MQILLQSWPFIVILLYLWWDVAYLRNSYKNSNSKWYLFFTAYFLGAALAITVTSFFIGSNTKLPPTPIYTKYGSLEILLLPFLVLIAFSFGKHRLISRRQLANFLVFRCINLDSLNAGLAKHKLFPFFTIITTTLSVSAIVSTLIYAEFQTCNTLDILFGISGCRAEAVYSSKSIQTITYSQDGSQLAIGGSDGLLKIVNSQTLEQQQDLAGVNNWTDAVGFSADSKLLATSSWDGTVRVWKVADGSLFRKFVIAQNENVANTKLIYSPNSSLLAASTLDKGIRVWRIADGTLLHTLTVNYSSIAFTHDNKQLVVQSPDNPNNIIFLNLSDWSIARTLPVASHFLALINNDTQILTRNDKTGFQVWDVASQKLLYQIHSQSIIFAVSPDNQLIAVPKDGEANGVEILEISTGRIINSFEIQSNDIASLDFSPDSKNLAVNLSFQVVQIWKVGS